MTRQNKKHKQKIKERGITLIALVITIIVLLILAGVTLVALTGDSGILSNAEKAKDDYKVAEEKEMETLQQWADMINDKIKEDSNDGSTGEGTGDGDNEGSSGDGKDEEQTTISVKDIDTNLNEYTMLDITIPSSVDASKLKYQSSDDTKVVIYSNGTLYGTRPGKATISVIYEGETVATCEVTVLGIIIEDNDIELNEGDTWQVTVTSTVEGNIVYKSNNETAFTVSDTGLITAKSAGAGNLIVTCGDYEYIQQVLVMEKIESGGVITEPTDPEF